LDAVEAIGYYGQCYWFWASATGSSTANASGSSGGLPTGAKVSIAVGVVPALLAIGFFVFRQRRKRAAETKAAEVAAFHQTSQTPTEFVKYQRLDYSNAGFAPREISNQGQIYEAYGSHNGAPELPVQAPNDELRVQGLHRELPAQK
jgi:hypothetical protein